MDQQEFRQALGSFATGVTIITTRGADGRDVGVTANSFNSVSLDPPMVLWSLSKESGSLDAFAGSSHFAVHILAADQVLMSNRFASRTEDKFAGMDPERGQDGVPLLTGCNARFECRTAYCYEGGDHVIFVGEVVSFDHRAAPPLLFHAGRYANAELRVEGVEPSIAQRDLGHLVQRAYFQLLGPVRAERLRLGVGLHDHYVLGVLMVGPRLLADIDRLISYTGLRATADLANDLARRGLVSWTDDGDEQSLSLTKDGKDAVLRLYGAAQAAEAEVALHVTPQQLLSLKTLLIALSEAFGQTEDSVIEHMQLLDPDFRKSIPTPA